jgi:aminopeptidase N
VPSRRQVIRLAELLASAPTVSYREHEVFARIRAELDRAGVPYASDRWGNLLAQTCPSRPRGRPVAFTAHADHPGLIISSCRGRIADARWLGGVQKKYFRGTSVRIETADGPVRGKVISARPAANGRIAWLRLSLERPVPDDSIGGWDLAPFRQDGSLIRTKSADDLIGCAAVLSLLIESAKNRLPYTIYGVFTRAEEEGLLGATALAADRTLPAGTAVVVLETSKEMPCGQIGKGPIVRVGDRKSVYTPGVCQAIHEAAETLAKRARGFRFQRGLMDGGVCEATSFQAFGYEAGALAIALGNYHNMGARAVEEEVVSSDDLWNLSRLLPFAAAKIASSTDGLSGIRRRLEKRLPLARKQLAITRALDPPPFAKAAKRAAVAALVCAALLGLSGRADASTPWWSKSPIAAEWKRPPVNRLQPPFPHGEVDPRDDYDALRYDITLSVDPVSETISGSVRMLLRPDIGIGNSLVLDLAESLTADSAAANGLQTATSRPAAGKLAIALPPEAFGADTLDIFVRYHGQPGPGDFTNFKFFSNHGILNDYVPVISTFSEPENAHSWWPCKDRMDDKAIVSLSLETPPGYIVAGNGNRLRGDGIGRRERTTWGSNYPVSTYLVSFAATNYAAWNEIYRTADHDSVELQYYAFPEDEWAARVDFAYAVTDSATSCLTSLERLFGPYPFRDRGTGFEKLGIAEVPWGSLAMEHQTCVSLGDAFIRGDSSSTWAITHEIAHQWWGDAVTPVSMDHIWLNEGFATYCEALHIERLAGTGAYRDWMGVRAVPASTDYLSSLVSPDPGYWFLKSLTYNKGAWLLHMLRGEIGDDAFFTSLNGYFDRYRYGNASTDDFIRAVEEGSGGQDLRWFFIPWAYGTGRPEISWDWWGGEEGGRRQVRLLLRQEQRGPIYPKGAPMPDPPEVFSFHLPVRIFGDADSLTRRVFVNERIMTAQIDSLPFVPRRVVLDPDHWVLSSIGPHGEGISQQALAVYPNPTGGGATFLVRSRGSEATRLSLFDVQGRKIRELQPVRGEGFHAVSWDGADGAGNRLASGVYLLKTEGGSGPASARVVVVR